MIRKALLMVIPILSLLGYCDKNITEIPVKQFDNYILRQDLPLHERISSTPKVVMDFWLAFDGRKDYTTYMPSSKEIADIKNGLDLLPPLHKKVLKERLLGIYCIKNFLGSGAADWVADKKKNLYFYIVINPKILAMKDLTENLTWREQSCFVNESDVEIFVNCGRDTNQMSYVFLHEGTHILDYFYRITPYVEKEMMNFNCISKIETVFTKGIWKSINVPVSVYQFRKDVTFYGLDKGPRIKASDAPEIYRGLSESPFVSLYGSKSWAEDLADYVTFYHITQKLKLPYIITVKVKGKKVISYKPMDNQEVKKRFGLMKMFYENNF